MTPHSPQQNASLTSGWRRWMLAAVASSFVALTACGGGSDNAVDRGPTTLNISAKLNGLYWDKSASKLYLTDDASNSIQVWDGNKTFTAVATLPTAPASGATLGQLTKTSSGTMYTTRFGFGTDGAIVAIPGSGVSYNLKGLDPLRRRIGITTAPDGALIDGWFIKGATGSVSQLTLSSDGAAATEKELVSGLGKPVGVAAVGDTLYVSDQNSGNVLSYSLSQVRKTPATVNNGKVLATFTTLDGIDLMTAASDGTLYFGGSGGRLFQINTKGETKVLASGWPKIIGVAFDETHRRLFAAVSAANANSSASIRIVPVD